MVFFFTTFSDREQADLLATDLDLDPVVIM